MKNTNAETTNYETTIETDAPRRKSGSRRGKLTRTETPLLFLVPLVETAWAHGAIARNEKQLIFAAAREEAIDEKHPLNETLDEMLVYQPGKEFFGECLSLIKQELAAMTVKERDAKRAKLFKRCREVAAAAGGNSVMDVDKTTSPEEREVLERIASELNFREDSPDGRRRNADFSVGKAFQTAFY